MHGTPSPASLTIQLRVWHAPGRGEGTRSIVTYPIPSLGTEQIKQMDVRSHAPPSAALSWVKRLT